MLDRPAARDLPRITMGVLAILVLIVAAGWVLLPFVAAGVWGLLRVSVRTIADLPDEYLDERQERVRNRAYVEAYRLLATIAVVGSSAGLVAFIVLGQDPDTWAVTLSWNAVSAI